MASISDPNSQTPTSNHLFADFIVNRVMILPELALSNPHKRMKSIHLLLLCSLGSDQHSIPMSHDVEELEHCKGRRRRSLQAVRSAARPVPSRSAARPKFGPRRHLQSRIAHHLLGCSPTLENWMLTGFVGLQVFAPGGARR